VTTTIPEIADKINELFRTYGLTHDVVWAKPIGPAEVEESLPRNLNRLDPRENEPDPMKWRRPVPLHFEEYELVFLGGAILADMSNLLLTFEELFQGYFEAHPPTDQLRLF